MDVIMLERVINYFYFLFVLRPYYHVNELGDFLKLQLKSNKNNGKRNKPNTSTDKSRKKKFTKLPKNDGERIIAALRAKTRQALRNPAISTIPARLRNGLKKTFGIRRHFDEANDDELEYYYNDTDDEANGPLPKLSDFDDDPISHYDYYDEKKALQYVRVDSTPPPAMAVLSTSPP